MLDGLIQFLKELVHAIKFAVTKHLGCLKNFILNHDGIRIIRQRHTEEKQFLSSLENRIYKYMPSDIIISEGEVEHAFYIILKGVVRIVKGSTREITITKLKAGAIFGEIAVIANRKRMTSVIADGDVVALKVDTKCIDTLQSSIPNKLKNNFISVLVNRLEAMNEQITQNA
ncbi:MAG: cyclic nucleotide-binding domain-containing protein [Nitrospinae bacterium]|nr:cyclic nucleotide-binding domain-containing protein [Nitrospinota bacterium]